MQGIDTTVNGISNEGIDKVMLDLLDYADKSNKTLNQIDDLIDETKNYFACESGEIFREQFEMLKTGFRTIHTNLISYHNDLMRVKQNYQLRQETGVEILRAGEKSVPIVQEREELK